MERWGDGERGRWRDGEMGREGDGERGRWEEREMGREGDRLAPISSWRRFAIGARDAESDGLEEWHGLQIRSSYISDAGADLQSGPGMPKMMV